MRPIALPRTLAPLFVLGAVVVVAPLACGGDDDAAAAKKATGPTNGDGPVLPARQDPVIPKEHPRIYMHAKDRLNAKLSGNAPEAKRFTALVDSQISGKDNYNFQPWHAALLGALGGDAKYCTYAIAQTDDRVTSEEKLIAGGDVPDVAHDDYLDVGDVVGGLAIVYDACYAKVSDTQKTRWLAYANQAVFNVWNPNEAKWGGKAQSWAGWAITNPFNNYHYSFLRATMLLGLATNNDIPEGAANVDFFRKNKLATLVDAFEKDLQGGGSREGTGYGASHRELFEIYDFWEATTGERIWDLTAHTRTSLPYFMHSTVPTEDFIAPIGDQSRDSTAAFFDYHRELVLALQHLLGPTDPLTDVAQTFLEGASVKEMGQGFEFVWDFLYTESAHAKQPLSKLQTTYYAPGTGMTFLRSSWGATDAMWGGLAGGPFTESHAHRDQGSLLIFKNEWLGYDENVSSSSGIQQGEELHNLVRLVKDGATVKIKTEKGPNQTTAVSDAAQFAHWAGNLAPEYDTGAVTRDDREVVFIKPLETFVVFDRIDADVTSAVWQLNTPVAPTLADGKWTVNKSAKAALEVFLLQPTDATSNVVTWTAVDSDYRSGARLDMSSSGHTRFLTVLAAKGRVTSANGAVDGASTRATLAFAGGATATISFTTDSAGGHVKVTGGGADVDTDLGTTVTTIPALVP